MPSTNNMSTLGQDEMQVYVHLRLVLIVQCCKMFFSPPVQLLAGTMLTNTRQGMGIQRKEKQEAESHLEKIFCYAKMHCIQAIREDLTSLFFSSLS